jgi:hypothetical protein
MSKYGDVFVSASEGLKASSSILEELSMLAH